MKVMKKWTATFAGLLVLFWIGSVAATETHLAPNQKGLVVIDSANSMMETEKRLLAALDSFGLKVAARVDHQANAKSVGLDLPPTVLFIFGNPKAGTGLIEKEPTIGIDLPLKILLWDDKGKVKIAYNDPAYVAQRHGLDVSLPVLAQIADTLQKLATRAASS